MRILWKARTAIRHYPYYVNCVRSLPYAALRRITRRKCYGYAIMIPFLAGKRGLEIGGPSRIFAQNHLIPVYTICSQIDSCNFSNQTIWNDPSDCRRFGPRLGKQFIDEACNLAMVPDGTYDFLLASHVLEHIANPLRALREWKRKLISAGLSSLDFRFTRDGCWTDDKRIPEHAVAFEEEYIRAQYRDLGFTVETVRYGAWCGRTDYLSYQDLVVATKT